MTATDRTTAGDEKPTGDTEDGAQSESTDTPAAHIRTLAPMQDVEERVDTTEGVVRITHRSDDIETAFIYEPSDAEALADRLVTAAADAREYNGAETDD